MIEKKRRRGGEKKKKFFFLKAIKFTESAAFCRVGRVTGNNNNFLLGLIKDTDSMYGHAAQIFFLMETWLNNAFKLPSQ